MTACLNFLLLRNADNCELTTVGSREFAAAGTVASLFLLGKGFAPKRATKPKVDADSALPLETLSQFHELKPSRIIPRQASGNSRKQRAAFSLKLNP